MLPSGVGAGYTRKKTPRAEFVFKTQRTGVLNAPVLCVEEVFEMLCRKRIWVNRVRLKKTIQPAYLLWPETKATVIASVLEGGLVQRKTGNLRNVSLSAPRIPGGTPPSRLLPSVIFCHAASCALNRGATPSLHTARWTRRQTGYRHLSRDMVEVVPYSPGCQNSTVTGRFPLLGPPTSLIPASLKKARTQLPDDFRLVTA